MFIALVGLCSFSKNKKTHKSCFFEPRFFVKISRARIVCFLFNIFKALERLGSRVQQGLKVLKATFSV
jgi:hypothetical protein